MTRSCCADQIALGACVGDIAAGDVAALLEAGAYLESSGRTSIPCRSRRRCSSTAIKRS